MRVSRVVGLTLGAYLLVGAAISARATIDLTGRWVLDINFFGTQFSEVWNITQTSTSLTQSPPSSGQTGPRTGMIDSTTGAFTLSDQATCNVAIGPTYCTFSGTAAPDGLTFTGTLNCVAPTPTHCADGPASVMATRSPITCGNGVVDPGEQCDDGAANGTSASCCSLGCLFVPQGTACGTSPNVCVPHNVCDGAGQCVAGGPPLTCDPCSSCDPMAAGCTPSPPATTCKAPTVARAAVLTLETGKKLRWKWTKGQATTLADFGDPVTTDGYALCIYDTSSISPRLVAAVPSGSKWRATGTRGFKYTDKLGTADGVTGITLKAGVAGKAKVTFAAKGASVVLSNNAQLEVPVTVQLRGHGECWGASYVQAGVKKNTTAEFIARSSPSGAFLDDPSGF